jgi:Helix-turn-helix domain
MKPTAHSAKQTAELLHCSEQTVYRLYKSGELQGYRVGKFNSKRARMLIYDWSIAEYKQRNSNQALEAKVRQQVQQQAERDEREARLTQPGRWLEHLKMWS